MKHTDSTKIKPVSIVPKTQVSPPINRLPVFGDSYQEFGCTVNQISVQDLFTRYESSGFLYPAKRQRLMPYMPIIMENWRKSMSAPRDSFLHDVVVHEDRECGAWASVTMWATTNESMHSQHLISSGNPSSSCAVMLSGQSESYGYLHRGSQNWFRPENRFPSKVFGTCVQSLGEDLAVVHEHAYLRIDRGKAPGASHSVHIDEVGNDDARMIERLARRLCGPVQAEADEWDKGDVELDALDARYQRVGLRRYRRVFIARVDGQQEPIGFAVAYRGPLGLNFSFLENRCEIWIDPRARADQRKQALTSILHATSGVYHDFELPDLLITVSRIDEDALIERGAKLIQHYNRSVWLRDGYEAWYKHVDRFYDRIMERMERAMSPARTTVNNGGAK
tara:strand:- start:263440 stop:264618 length:1179 start_codon:yes stop_codon:yes gene_type:complete